MDKFLINGGYPLKGSVNISGAKNAAVAILPSAILSNEVTRIGNIPEISDVKNTLQNLQEIGAEIKVIDRNTVEIDPRHVASTPITHDMTKKLRASYYLIGVLLAKFNYACVSMPGGCDFGVRPIDQHLKGFKALGCQVNIDSGMVEVKADKMIGSYIYLDVTSVGATMNIMIAAVKARGLTTIDNAAKEPHIVDLANFLNSMGADIRGAGTDTIKIYGVDKLHGTDYVIIPDQIEAGTFMVAAAATYGDVMVNNVIPKHLESITAKLLESGACVDEYDEAIRVYRDLPIRPCDVKAMPHPAFPTDMQPQITTMLSVANGTSHITEGVWDNRFKYVGQLSRMGANIKVEGKIAVVEGVKQLTSAPVRAIDLRAGAAMMIAAFMANGKTTIEDIIHIDRGYDHVEEKFTKLGADIHRVTEDGIVVPAVL